MAKISAEYRLNMFDRKGLFSGGSTNYYDGMRSSTNYDRSRTHTHTHTQVDRQREGERERED